MNLSPDRISRDNFMNMTYAGYCVELNTDVN